ncbi:hypothetical protein CC85DRAFT_36274 [Cutaneotrichosporon oleaginosum]|uniref:F-box domain-containing protein n=1 Tax=Cutaneotrichosporon oleaginosum TaxID=879819 RepID=A0A0J0XSE0_9TREE|nr:uncharacterized protein CC85DRAFT_36274 [Cutaneotrichosporon oleaginosum]KLT43982.1 hypothetical protein CC85DRAFT_36274 [Cutaneotrichosporon oleaginosum]TXT04071.1 hypothetical protein COLE_07768 [Cutaneotrichosporon oleaginosum]
MLDAAAFPHIIDRIIELSDIPALVQLRTASRYLRSRVDARLFDHILLQWDKEGTELTITSPHPPFAHLPIRLSPPSLGDRLRRLKLALGADPEPTAGGAYVLAAHLPSLTPLEMTRTIDVHDHSFPIPGWPHFTPEQLPPLPKLERTRATFPLLSPRTVIYLNIRAPPGERTLRGTALRNRVSACSAVDIVVHLFFDAMWDGHGMDLLKVEHARHVTLVLHPAKEGTAPPMENAGSLVCPTSIEGEIRFTLVGLETVPPSMLGLPPAIASGGAMDVQNYIASLPGGDRVEFQTLAEWTRDVHPLESEVPAHIVREVARTAVWSPIIIDKDSDIMGS